MALLTAAEWDSFKWRVINTFKSVIIPAVVPIILFELTESPNDLSVLLSKDLWLAVGYAALVALLGSLVAGLDKVYRMNK